MPRRHSLRSQKCKTPNNLSNTSVKEGRSILKKRQRKPLQEVVDLHLSADTNVPRSSSRRVSFAVSEVKEFRQPANEGTLWGSSYFVDIQKSSSESEHTESSTSGTGTSGLIYSQQVIVQETTTYSYSDTDEREEFREDILPDEQSNPVHELIDAANQTEESVFQDLNKSRDPEQNNVFFREVASTNLQPTKSGKKFWNPGETLGEFMQSIPKTIPCETFERQSARTLSYPSVSKEIDLFDKDVCLPMNTLNKDHVANLSIPCRNSLKHSRSLCDDSFETAKKQKIGTQSIGMDLQAWLKKEEEPPVNEQQSPIWSNNQLHFFSTREKPHHFQGNVEHNMQNYSHVSKLPMSEEQFVKAPQSSSNQPEFPESLSFSNANTFIDSNINRTHENEISNNTSDMSMSFTLTNAPLLNISSTNEDGSRGTTSDNLPVREENSNFVNAIRSVSPTMPVGRIISQGQSNPLSGCKDISGVSVSPTLPAGRILGEPHMTNRSLDITNASSSVSPTMSMGRVISLGQSSPLSGCKNISGVSVSPTLPAGRILDKPHKTNENSDFVNASRSVSPTMPIGRIISQGQSSPHSGCKDISGVSVSPTLPAGRILGEPHMTNRSLDLTNASRSVSPMMSMARIISQDQSSPLSCCKVISGVSMSQTLPAGRILDKPCTTNENSGFVNASKGVSSTMPMGRIIGLGQSSPYSGYKDISGVSVSPTLPAGRILGELHMTNRNSDFTDASRSVSPTMPMERVISLGQSSPLSGCKNISGVSVSPTLPAGRILDKPHKTNENSDFVNASRSVSPTMPIGRIISQGQSNPLSGCKDISGVSVSQTLRAGRVLGELHMTNRNSDFTNASRSVSPTMPTGRIISQDQSGPLSGCKDISGVSVLQTLPAGRVIGELHMTNGNSDFTDASRSVSPTMPMGRIISQGQSSPLSGCKDISDGSVSLTLPAGRILDKPHTTNENSDFTNASRSVSPTMPMGRIIHQGQSNPLSGCKDISGVSVSQTLPAGRILGELHMTNRNLDFTNASRSVSPTIPMEIIIGEKHSIKIRGFEETCRRSVSPTMPMSQVLNNKMHDVNAAPGVERGNINNEQGAVPNCASLKLASIRDLESTSPLQECNPVKNVSPSVTTRKTAVCDNYVSLTETLGKMCVAENFAVECFPEDNKESPHCSLRKHIEKICNNAEGCSAVVDSNVSCKREIQIGSSNNTYVATCGNVWKETQDLSCKNMQIGFYSSITRMVETGCENLGAFVKDEKDTVDKIERTSNNLNEENNDLPVIKINNISIDLSENIGSNPAVVVCERDTAETMVLDIEKDSKQKTGENSLASNLDYDCSKIKLKEDVNNEENGDHCESIIYMNVGTEINLSKCFINNQIVCNSKSTEKENYSHSNSFTNSEPDFGESDNVRFCGTSNLGEMINNGSETNSVNKTEICTDDCDKEKVMFCSEKVSEMHESDTELDLVSPPIEFHICNDNSLSSEAIGKDNTLLKDDETRQEVISDKCLVASTMDAKIVSCNEKTSLHVNREEINEIHKKLMITESVSEINRPSICISGIDYIDWKSSLDMTNALVNGNKSRIDTIFSEAQESIQDTSISIAKTQDNNYSSGTEEIDISKSSLISLSNIQNDEFEGANDVLIKSFRSQGRNDLLKERRASSFSFHNEMSMARTIKTPCKVEIEASTSKLKSPQHVQPVTKLMNVDEKPPVLEMSPVQSVDDRGVNFSTDYLRSLSSDNLQSQDYRESTSSSNSTGTCAKTENTIKNEVKRSVELPSDRKEEDKTEMHEIHSHTYSKSTDQIMSINAKNDVIVNENKTMKGDVEGNIELPTNIQVNEIEMSEINPMPSKSTAQINFTNAESDIVINESKTIRGDAKRNIELSSNIQVNEIEMAEINSPTSSKSTTQINFNNAECDFVINESKTIKGDVERNIELSPKIQENSKEMAEINFRTCSESTSGINCVDERDSPLQKKGRFSSEVAPTRSTLLSYCKSLFRKENQSLDSTSLERNYSKVFECKDVGNDLSSQMVRPFSFERWLQEQQESKKCPWKVELTSSSKINFYFLEKNVKVYVEIDPSNLNLTNIDIKCHLEGNCTKVFLQNLLLTRLKLDTLKDRFPTKHDIPALINFISTEEKFILDFAKDWLDLKIRHAIQMKENFCAEFEVTSIPLSWLCEIKIDLSFWNGERLHSRYVHVCPVIGEINVAEIKRLMRAIPGGPHLLKDYISHLHNYIHVKERSEGNKRFLSLLSK